MKHGIKHSKFGRDRDQRQALFRALVTSLCKHGRIETTLVKAKTIQPIIEKLVTKAKKDNLASIRAIAGYVYEDAARVKLFEIAKLSTKRNGGYTRIYKKGPRISDAAPMAIIEFVDSPKAENK